MESDSFLLSMLLASDEPFELVSLLVPLVDADDDVGEGSDFGDMDPFVVPFSVPLRRRNL